MKKTLIIVGIVAAVILLPVLGMAISPTRNLLLGLAPDEQILALADKIDENRLSNEQAKSETDAKITEMQSIIDSQKVELTSYQQQVAGQEAKIEENKTNIQATNTVVAKQKDCSADVAKYCVSDSFKDASEFANFLKAYEKFDNYSEYKSKYTTQFNNCQKALKCE